METRFFPSPGYDDQRPGTAGLRKKVKVFQQPGYLETFLQAVFDGAGPFDGKTLVAGGDGRYFNREALQTLASLAAANGVSRLIVGRGGLLSTPAASNLVRQRGADGGFILSASHNPGGPDGDFGVKFNTGNGGQASESLMAEVYRATQTLDGYRLADIGDVDFDRPGERRYGGLTIEVVDPVSDYAALMERLFDFDRIGALLSGGGFRMRFDAMHAITGPYATDILERRLGAPAGTVVNGKPLEDFGGGHPDPNPVDAAALVAYMSGAEAADFAAASDGDGDRNMIVGRGMVVSPGDSLAIMLANATICPGYRSGIPGVARSMPTSRAVDSVARELGIPLYETPTGWRYFCNLLESGDIALCGEESFGTSSNHAREKDGLWAVLFWLNLMAGLEQSVDEIVLKHWQRFGRCYFQRRDYFIADADQATALMQNLTDHIDDIAGRAPVESADIFCYTDPVDGSVSKNQGIRVFMANGGRIVFRLSGTGTSGATLRVYLDKQEDELIDLDTSVALAELADSAAELAQIEKFTGLQAPTAII